MFNFILQFAKSKTISILSKVNIKEIVTKTNKSLDILPNTIKQIQKIKKELEPIVRHRDPVWQRWLPFTLIYGSGKIQPVYVWITVFCSLGAWMIYIKNHAASLAIKNGTYTPEMISDTSVATVLAFISSLILLYNTRKKDPIVTNIVSPITENKEGDKQP